MFWMPSTLNIFYYRIQNRKAQIHGIKTMSHMFAIYIHKYNGAEITNYDKPK